MHGGAADARPRSFSRESLSGSVIVISNSSNPTLALASNARSINRAQIRLSLLCYMSTLPAIVILSVKRSARKVGRYVAVVDELMRTRFPRLHSLFQGRDYHREHSRLRSISVNSRLSVSSRRLSRRSARWASPSTDGKRSDFETVAFSPHDECVLVLEMHSKALCLRKPHHPIGR